MPTRLPWATCTCRTWSPGRWPASAVDPTRACSSCWSPTAVTAPASCACCWPATGGSARPFLIDAMTEWNAHAYTRLSTPMQTWGETIVESLPLRGDETALDLGCGSGRLTEFLLRRLPHGRVLAIDRSANMLEAAREHLEPEFGGRVEYIQKSLDALDLREVADLAFSNAAFHWVPDHPRLFRAVFNALKPGGWLVAQCGAS